MWIHLFSSQCRDFLSHVGKTIQSIVRTPQAQCGTDGGGNGEEKALGSVCTSELQNRFGNGLEKYHAG